MSYSLGEITGLSQPIFFKPNTEMVKWLIEYAGDRIIIDCGCGEKFLLTQQLFKNGAKAVLAIDPIIDNNEFMKFRTINHEKLSNISIHIMPGRTEKWKDIIGMGDAKGILLVFARPCHSSWMEETLDLKSNNTEALYITIPENLEKYNDLGKYKSRATLIEHRGSSADKEVVYSIK